MRDKTKLAGAEKLPGFHCNGSGKGVVKVDSAGFKYHTKTCDLCHV